jgi:hypothetical protein
MKRKLLLSSTLASALLASGAMAQVVNFHDDNSGSDPISYDELFAGQGAYADPGNNIWNGFIFAHDNIYQSTWFYSGDPGSGAGVLPQQYGNPGNPYAAYYNGSGVWVSSTGGSLFLYSGSLTTCGNSDSSGQWTPITLSVSGPTGDTGSFGGTPNGSPEYLLGMSSYVSGGGTEVYTLQNVPAGTYGLFLYGATYFNNRGTLFSLNSGNAHNGIAATLNGQNGVPAQTFVEGQNFVIFENVTPDGSGNITITATPNPQDGVGNGNLSGQADVNGFQLISNPPPTAVAPTAAQNVLAGGTASFSFSPAFASSPTFHWQFISGGVTTPLSDGITNGATISGSVTTNLTVANVTPANVGLYQCVITAGTATGTSPAAPLTIVSSTNNTPLQAGDLVTVFSDVLAPGDTLSDFNNYMGQPLPYTSVPPPWNMTVANVEDGTLSQYLNYGANGSIPPFSGPVGFTVTPKAGATVVTGLRIFTASSHPEDDPADYLLEGSTNGGSTYTAISGGLLGLPAQRNAAGGPINIANQALQEIDFANTAAYTTYRLTFTNVCTNVYPNGGASNGVQVAEVQLLGSLAPLPPGILQQPEAAQILLPGGTLRASVVADGPGPFSYQWYVNSSQMPNATNAALMVSNVQTAATYQCVVSNSYGPVTSAPVSLTVVTPTPYEAVVWADQPVAFYPLNETGSATTAYDYVNTYNGAYLNSPSLNQTGPSSELPAAAGFDGTSQSVLVPDTPALDFGGQITLEAWVQPGTQTVNWADIIGKGYTYWTVKSSCS